MTDGHGNLFSVSAERVERLESRVKPSNFLRSAALLEHAGMNLKIVGRAADYYALTFPISGIESYATFYRTRVMRLLLAAEIAASEGE